MKLKVLASDRGSATMSIRTLTLLPLLLAWAVAKALARLETFTFMHWSTGKTALCVLSTSACEQPVSCGGKCHGWMLLTKGLARAAIANP